MRALEGLKGTTRGPGVTGVELGSADALVMLATAMAGLLGRMTVITAHRLKLLLPTLACNPPPPASRPGTGVSSIALLEWQGLKTSFAERSLFASLEA